MLALIYLWAHLTLWQIASHKVFSAYPAWVRTTLGLAAGLLAMMWTPVPFAWVLGFGLAAHGLALVFSGLLAGLSWKFSPAFDADGSPDHGALKRTLPWLLLPLLLLLAWLFHTHVLLQADDGWRVGQSTFGDLQMHLGMISSLARQGVFPPEYSILPGQKLSYPFLVNLLSSSLYLLGMSLRWAVILPSLLLCGVLASGFILLTHEIARSSRAVIFAFVLFFLNGGLGFIYFMGGGIYNFARMLGDFYHTPTNLNELNIRWSNVICDMIIPQRTTMAGWAIVICVFWLLLRAIRSRKLHWSVAAGVGTGLLPMVHTHSFLGLAIISVVWSLTDLWQNRESLRPTIHLWLGFAIPATLLGIGQILYWTMPQASSGGFMRIHLNWVNELKIDPWLWFYIKNIGVVFVGYLACLAWMARGGMRELRTLQWGPLALFLLAEIVVFQPNLYDNNKLFYLWYIFATITVAAGLDLLLTRLNQQGRAALASWIVIPALIIGCLAGSLTILRELASSYVAYGPNHVEAARFIDRNTPADAMFLTHDNHNNTVAALTGRNIVVGGDVFLFFHGLDTRTRHDDVKRIFRCDPDSANLLNKYRVDYIFLGDYEIANQGQCGLEQRYPVVFGNSQIKILAVSPRARQQGKPQQP